MRKILREKQVSYIKGDFRNINKMDHPIKKDDGNLQKYNTFDSKDVQIYRNGDSGGKDFTVGEAIEYIGFGKFQIMAITAAGLAWLADGMEIMVLSILGPTLMCEWYLNTTDEALITTVVFVGFLLGSPVFGFVADGFGRRKSLLVSCTIVFYFGLLSSFSPSYAWLLFLRLVTGFGVGGAPQAITYSAEFLPNKSRGRTIILVEVFWAIGGMIEVILALLILLPYGWRPWLAVSSIPSLLYVFVCAMMPDSPRYSLAVGKVTQAKKTLDQAAKINGKTPLEGQLVPEPIVETGNVSDLVKPGLKVSSVILPFLWCAAAFSYYGIILFSTDLIIAGDTCDPGALNSDNSNTCAGGCQELTTDNYYDLLWTSAAEVPGLLLTAVLVDTIGRRLTIVIEFFIFAATCFILCICMSRVPMIIVLFIGRAIISSAFQVLYVYTPEVYPTPVRALSVGFGSGFGRLGAIITPYVAQVLLDSSLYAGLGVYGIIGTLAGILAAFLPLETKGMSLHSISSSQ